MTAHIIYKKLINKYSNSFKENYKINKKNIKFNNILMSDDISMKSLKGSIQLIQ